MDYFFRAYSRALRVQREGASVALREFFGRSTDAQFGPEAFLVEQPPDITIGAHFHDVDQFQVFFSSPGATYQREPISTVTLHYADAYSTYGPFASGPTDELHFFTLRAHHSSMHADMPGSRDKLLYRGRRQKTIELGPVLSEEPAEHSGTVTLIAAEEDGLAADLVTVAPGDELNLPVTNEITGRYYCVLSGELVVDGEPLEARSLGWSTSEGTTHRLGAGEAGCQVLALDFPFPATPDAHHRAS
jgi:hypothetical protein